MREEKHPKNQVNHPPPHDIIAELSRRPDSFNISAPSYCKVRLLITAMGKNNSSFLTPKNPSKSTLCKTGRGMRREHHDVTVWH